MNVYQFKRNRTKDNGQLITVQSHLSFLAEKLNAAANSDLAIFLSEWEGARDEAIQLGSNGSGVEDARIFWLPDEEGLIPCFMWDDLKDGTVWVVSKVDLLWIKNLYNKYLDETEEGEEDEPYE